MRVLLINAEAFHVKHKAAIPLGLLSIATYLDGNGHEVQIFDRTVESTSLSKKLNSFLPDVVGIAAPSFKCFSDAVKISKVVKKRKTPVVWGGPITSLMPDIVLKTEVVDYVVMGEGEITFLELINAIGDRSSVSGIDGLAYVENEKVVINTEREFADLADLPIIDFKFVDPKRYFVENIECQRMLHVYASKGCVCRCTYCYNPYFSQCVWRPRPFEYFLSEIRNLVENYGMDGLCFADDLLSPNKKYLTDLCNSIIDSGIRFIWGGELRADVCDKEHLQLMYDSGCRWLYFGIESGSETRQRAIKKNLNLEKTKQAIKDCAEIGIVTSTSFIMNFPDETEEELKLTIQYILDLKPDLALPSFYGPIPKSEIYENLVEQGKIIEPKTYKEWEKIKMMDLLGTNYSTIPDLDLKVVSASFYFRGLLWKGAEEEKIARVNLSKALRQVLGFMKNGFPKGFYLVALAAKEFIVIAFYALMFPKIRKKYGLIKVK